MSYEIRSIKIQVTLVNSTFDSATNSNTLTIENCKALAIFQANGGISGYTMQLTVWGLSLEHITKIMGTANSLQTQSKSNRIRVWESDNLFFEGMITTANPNIGSGDIGLELACRSSAFSQYTPVSQTEISSGASFVSAMKQIAAKVNLTVNSYIDDFQVSPAFYRGDAISQVQQLANAYRSKNIAVQVGFDYIDIIKYGTPRSDTAVIVGPDNGLVGYPSFIEYGIAFTCWYTPKLITGQLVDLTSALPNATGEWIVAYCTHEISAWIPDGPYFSHVMCSPKTGVANA